MNRTRTIALFAGIFAIAMTTYGLTGVSASPMIMSSIIPQTHDDVTALGHAEFTVFGSDGKIKSYTQTDNDVVFIGKDCAGELIFGSDGGNGNCVQTGNVFDYIAIGNDTGVADNTKEELQGGVCAVTGDPGELARKQVTPTNDVGASGSGGTEIVLDVGSDTFKFEANNATTPQTITQSGIFNGDNARDATTGECNTYNNANWDMFAIRNISVDVTSGDSLAVKWTITLN